MKKFLPLIMILLSSKHVCANHIIGGEVFYKYVSQGTEPGTSVYEIAIKLFRDCNTPCGNGTNVACLPVEAQMTIYPAVAPYTSFHVIKAPLKDSQSITLTTYPPCIGYKPPVCYQVKMYSYTVTLPDTEEGYIIAYQNCCRDEAQNQYGVVFTASGIPGATYTATIPGKNTLQQEHNNSAIFKLKDTALVCIDNMFSIDFSAYDSDDDSLSYAFAPAYDGGLFFSDGCIATNENGLDCSDLIKAAPPPYNFITYKTFSGFSGTQPLGEKVSINAATGLISGYSPAIPGHYIVNVIVNEWRNGKIIASHQKDFIIRVEDCNTPVAKLDSVYLNCKGLDISFVNKGTSSLIHSYYWDFGDINTLLDTSLNAAPIYNYPDSGSYRVTLITNKGEECSDTATTLAKVYPGFIPDFNTKGGCILSPYEFTDRTMSEYGTINYWKWDFGDFATQLDTSVLQDPQYSYTQVQQAEVRLIVGDSKGCIDTVKKIIQVYDKPALKLSFTDTLICTNDTLHIYATDTIIPAATYNWSPVVNISNTNIPDPFIYPKTSTVYYVTVMDKGCVAKDSVSINVIPVVTVDAGKDTTICLGDSIRLFPVTNAVTLTWQPAINISDSNAKNPFVKPGVDTEYKVLAKAGSCSASDSIKIKVASYPQVSLNADTSICFGASVMLHATTSASHFAWSSSNSLLNANTLTPVAKPVVTTPYVITVTDTLGCPKPVDDTIIVTVIPIHANAGNDTAIIAGEPLQLNASGGTSYLWSPATGLNNAYIANPVTVLGTQFDSIMYHVVVKTMEGCSAEDTVKVIVFKTQADIFIPSAFTPNNDGLNDVLRPKPVGIKLFVYFRIYNQWGQLLYTTSTINNGWNGRFNDKLQPAGTYVYIAQGIDYTGKSVTKKGTTVLIY